MGIYLHEFTDNEREISIQVLNIPSSLFCKRVQVNPDKSRAMSTLTFLLLKLNTLHKETLL